MTTHLYDHRKNWKHRDLLTTARKCTSPSEIIHSHRASELGPNSSNSGQKRIVGRSGKSFIYPGVAPTSIDRETAATTGQPMSITWSRTKSLLPHKGAVSYPQGRQNLAHHAHHFLLRDIGGPSNTQRSTSLPMPIENHLILKQQCESRHISYHRDDDLEAKWDGEFLILGLADASRKETRNQGVTKVTLLPSKNG